MSVIELLDRAPAAAEEGGEEQGEKKAAKAKAAKTPKAPKAAKAPKAEKAAEEGRLEAEGQGREEGRRGVTRLRLTCEGRARPFARGPSLWAPGRGLSRGEPRW